MTKIAIVCALLSFAFVIDQPSAVNSQLLQDLFKSVERVVNGIAGTTVGVVRGGFNIINNSVTNVITSANSVSERIRRLLEEFRQRMLEGIPELGLPILDPLTIQRLDINFKHEAISLNGYADNLEIRYLSRFKLDYVDFDLLNKLTLNITFPFLYITGNYDIKGKFGDLFALHGKGPFWLKLYDLSLGTISQLRYNKKLVPGIYVESMRISVKLKKLENQFDNLMDDPGLGEVINKAITQLTPEGIDTIWDEIEPVISKIVVQIINDKLQDLELSHLVGRFFNFFKFNLNQGRISLVN